ncbi:MAG: response regulator [Chromatiales bacterium]|jgi:CheY-like chemotaxis protein/anti-sigma regulatory factor (Ser/Thr protein kinase)
MTDGQVTILIVDDEPLNLEIILEYLEDDDYNLKTAIDGQEAWEQLQANPELFDLILLDRMMPNMDGMELLGLIKGHPVLKNLPVILQTALASKQDIADGMAAGAYYYLTKPFEGEMLRSVVATAVGDRERYRSIQEQIDLSARMLNLLREGHFEFRTLDEARDLAIILANACPDPKRVIVGLSELLINAVEHGNLGITYEEKGELKEKGAWEQEVEQRLQQGDYASKMARVKLIREAGQIQFLITDEGAGFDFENYLEMDPARAFDNHGRGIAVARLLSFDSLEYHGNGNEVRVGVNV